MQPIQAKPCKIHQGRGLVCSIDDWSHSPMNASGIPCLLEVPNDTLLYMKTTCLRDSCGIGFIPID